MIVEHEHVPKVLDIEDKWEQDEVEVTVECTYCDAAGTVPARLVYDEDIVWMEPVELKDTPETTEEVPTPS